MKILMLTPYLPYPPSSGGQIRSYNLIKQLSQKHQITLYCLIKFETERKFVSELEKYCQEVKVFKRAENPWSLSNVLSTAFSSYPFLVIRNFSKEEKKDIERILKLQKFNIIHAETFYVSPHIPETNIPIVLVDQAIEYQVYQHFVQNFKWLPLKPFLWIDVLKIKLWETYYWKKVSKVIAVSERDASVMRQFVPSDKVAVVPNPVGEDLIEKVPIHFSKKILFMGNYAWLQNVEAVEILAEKIFPKIIQKISDVTLLIAGQNAAKVKNFQKQNIKVVDLEIDNIDGVKEAYHQSGVLVAPLYGPSGSRVKIVGGMAASLPVVTTSIGIEGIDATDGKSVLLGDTPEQIANLVVKILKDKKLYENIAINARKLIEEKYTYKVVAEKLDKVYQEVTGETDN